MYTKNELMFPVYAIPRLRDARGEGWRALIDRVASRPETHEDVLALMLLMIRLNGCMACETDSYRAMRGCSMCSLQTLRRAKETDAELVELFEQALRDIQRYFKHAGSPAALVGLATELA